ncbi:hypothetical protein ACN47E_000061 [Coniothyrium glycines]
MDGPPDEKKVFALISVVGTSRDRLRQAIDGLRQIHNRWQGSNSTSINLIAQITALKSNLGNMEDWLNNAIHDLHPHLLSDLAVLMTSCGLLVRHLDSLIRRLRQPDYEAVDIAITLKYAVASRSMEKLRQVAQHQNDAVTLLLAACKCHVSAQRKILLHKSRQIRKEDVSSLRTLARSTRWNGGCINFLSQVSRIIQWLRFLFHMKLRRSHIDRSLTPTEEEYDTAAAVIRSEAIDRALQEEATTIRRETKLVMVGHINSGKELIMHQMNVLYADGYYSKEQRKAHRYAVRSTVRLLIHAIIDLLKDTGINLPSHLNEHFAVILHEVETVNQQHLTPNAVVAVQNIWACPEFSTVYTRNFEIDFPQYASYFAHEIERIADAKYIPNEADIIRLNHSIRGIKELRFTWDELDVHLFNINGYVTQQFQNRWFHQLENATSLVYSIDVSQYDRPYLGQSSQSVLQEDFISFESWVNSPKFENSSIILLLNNFSRFRDKLAYSPLTTFFPDYKPSGDDPETSARQYLLKRFKALNRQNLSIYSFWVDLDLSDNQHLYAAVKKTLQHIQQRRARTEVLNANESSLGIESRSSLGISKVLSRSRSGPLLRSKASYSSRITDAQDV